MKIFSCFALLLMLVLPGCFTRDSRVAAAQKEAENRVRSYAANQNRLHAAEQKAFAIEAKNHIDTKFLWDLETVQRTAEQKQLAPAPIVAECKRLTFKRDASRETVDAKVAAARRLQDLSQRDLENFFKLESAVKRYDDEDGFEFGSLLNSFTGAKAEVVEPPADGPVK